MQITNNSYSYQSYNTATKTEQSNTTSFDVQLTDNQDNLKELDNKSQLGIERYNILNNKNWFDETTFSKDENLKSDFTEYLSNMDDEDFWKLNFKLWSSFGSGLMKDENDNVISGNHEKNINEEFSSISNIKNYFQDEIYRLEEGSKKFGGNPSEMLKLLENVVSFFNTQVVDDKRIENSSFIQKNSIEIDHEVLKRISEQKS